MLGRSLDLRLGQAENKRSFQRVWSNGDTTSARFTLDHDPCYRVTLLNTTVTLFPEPRLYDRRIISINIFNL